VESGACDLCGVRAAGGAWGYAGGRGAPAVRARAALFEHVVATRGAAALCGSCQEGMVGRGYQLVAARGSGPDSIGPEGVGDDGE
jgi:hypothetical protein